MKEPCCEPIRKERASEDAAQNPLAQHTQGLRPICIQQFFSLWCYYHVVNLPQGLTSRSLRLTTARVGRGHDRLVAQPAARGYAPADTVLGRNVARGIQVRIEPKPTLPTPKVALRTAVVAGGMPTAATHLRGVSRTHRDDRTTPFLGLILNLCLQTGERPAMHPALGLRAPLRPHPAPNVRQVFQDDRAACTCSTHDLRAQHVIRIPPKPRPSAFQDAQAPF